MERLEDLQTYLHTDIGRTIVIARTQRNLFAKVVALRMVQGDLLEAEEEYVLPVLRQRLTTAQQLDIARHLLIDAEAQDQEEIVEWVEQDLTATEWQLFAELTTRLRGTLPISPARTSALPANGNTPASPVSPGSREMPTALCKFHSPIDVMYPLHKALRAQAAAMEQMVRALETPGDLRPVAQTFSHWARALEYHAVTEDKYMTTLLPDRPSARDNEAAHRHLTMLLAHLHTALHETQAQRSASARMQRRVLAQVVTLRVAQDDHLEDEEELVLPVLRQRLSDAQQWAIAARLLLDQEAPQPRWILDWLAPYVTAMEAQWLAGVATGVAQEIPV
jgi:hypothetical protein